MRRLLSVLLLAGGFLAILAAEEEYRDLEWYLQEAADAVDSERYEYAVTILVEGSEKYPDNPVFPARLGDLYFDKELYSLALKEYQRAKERDPEDFDLLYSLATTQGMLNRDLESTATLEELLLLYPDSLDVIIDLGWMYFKTFQLARGEQLLRDALETYGVEPGLSMTLGTVYAGMYDYEKAKRHYLDSIEAALEEGRTYFASVAYYNLSLLEQTFYRFNDALDATHRSLQMAERAPGRIALGELYQLRADYPGARGEYQKAFSLDTTPLAKLNLADLYLEFGDPRQALAYLEEVKNTSDTSWMFYFGTDLKRHQLELHRISMDLYRSLSFTVLAEPRRGLQRLSAFLRHLGYRALSWYHGRKYRSLCLEVGTSYLEDGNVLDGNWFFYKGNQDYPFVARKYLERAEVFETSLAPEAAPWYTLEKGKLLENPEYLAAAAEDLDTEWERSGRVEALAFLTPLVYRIDSFRGAALYRELYKLNPGVFNRFGITLPVKVEGMVPPRVKRLLKRSPFNPVKKAAEAAFLLSFEGPGEGALVIRLLEPDTGSPLKAVGFPETPLSPGGAAVLVEELIAKFFYID
ncbi:MAG: hypothetical protein JW760_10825 [Spirochaetales bacterium]|nr:hypothetical protein [Spirochaetales bacterium]